MSFLLWSARCSLWDDSLAGWLCVVNEIVIDLISLVLTMVSVHAYNLKVVISFSPMR